jgi:hypothetical protein
LEDYEGIIGEVVTEKREPSPELLEAQRIQIDPDYGMKIRHERELEKIAEQASDEEQLLMARKMSFSVLAQAMWEIYSKEHEILEQIRGTF